jgi:PqqD family protein of HPr-rel-A system
MQYSSRRLWMRDGPELVEETFGSVCAVFDPATGETNFITELPALILTVIDEQPSTLQSLIGRLAGPIDMDQQAQEKVFTALEFLAAAELVESSLP